MSLSLLLAGLAFAQAVPYARTYLKSKEEVDSALKEMQAYAGQKLPIVEGFVAATGKPLDQFEHAFYEYSIDLLPGTSGATIVRVSAKITAWFADRDPAKSGYEVLPSNGRLELDLLDRLEEKLGGKPSSSTQRRLIIAPKPKIDLPGLPGAAYSPATSPAPNSQASGGDELDSLRTQRETAEKRMQELNLELQGLQEIQKNQVRPSNLVVVKKPGTPVLAKPEQGARVLFSAAEEDEFEFIRAEGEWIHVSISGPSRGYIRRSNLELPEFIARRLKSPNEMPSDDTPLAFRIAREENSSFPGNWEMLRGKSVKIYTVQPVSPGFEDTDAQAKLKFAASLFQKFSADSTRPAPEVAGVVVIFDSADGGMVGATLENIRKMALGSLSSDSFWKLSYLDPPEAFQPLRKN
ncbi:MAG TPA: hypothetical protein VMR90_02760 [Candidatus Cybelea sp.]|nr:hypothetical protein [Candidatus Cybelea sp.]